MADHDRTGGGAGALFTMDATRIDAEHANLVLTGRFDVLEAAGVRARLAADLAGIPHLVIDLTDVSFVDSAGLAVLARARRERQPDGSVVLLRPSADDAMRVFRLTQFDQIFTMRARTSGGTT